MRRSRINWRAIGPAWVLAFGVALVPVRFALAKGEEQVAHAVNRLMAQLAALDVGELVQVNAGLVTVTRPDGTVVAATRVGQSTFFDVFAPNGDRTYRISNAMLAPSGSDRLVIHNMTVTDYQTASGNPETSFWSGQLTATDTPGLISMDLARNGAGLPTLVADLSGLDVNVAGVTAIPDAVTFSLAVGGEDGMIGVVSGLAAILPGVDAFGILATLALILIAAAVIAAICYVIGPLLEMRCR